MQEELEKIKTSHFVSAKHIIRLLFSLVRIAISYYDHIIKSKFIKYVKRQVKLPAKMFYEQRRQKARLRIMNMILKKVLRPQQTTIIGALIISLLLIIILATLGFLDSIIALLQSDSFTLHIGNTQISLYCIIELVIFLIILLWFANQLSRFIKRRLDWFINIDAGLRTLIYKMAQISIYAIVFILISKIAGINLTSLAWFSGALGIGIGFGLQKIIANFISGLILAFENTLVPGAFIELEDGRTGHVKHIALRYTLLETLDGSEILIPNQDLMSDKLTNWTLSNSHMRAVIIITIAYDTDIDLACALILQVLEENERILTDKSPAVFLKDIQDKQVVLESVYWVDGITEYWQEVRSEILYEVCKKFKMHKINILDF